MTPTEVLRKAADYMEAHRSADTAGAICHVCRDIPTRVDAYEIACKLAGRKGGLWEWRRSEGRLAVIAALRAAADRPEGQL